MRQFKRYSRRIEAVTGGHPGRWHHEQPGIAGDFAGSEHLRSRGYHLASELTAQYSQLSGTVQAQLNQWKARDQTASDEIEQKRKALEDQGIKLDMGFIQKLANDAASAKQNLVSLDAWKKELQRLETERKAILQRRWSARSKIATLRAAFASKASTVLASALKDLTLSLKFVTDGYSPDAENLVTSAMGWKTVQVPRAAILIAQLTVPKLIDAVRAQNSQALIGLQSAPGVAGFTKGEADTILNRLNTLNYYTHWSGFRSMTTRS